MCRVHTVAPTLVQLPLLYYRHMLEVRDNGKAVRYGNLGRFVAVELGPGTHTIQVQFVGIRWANWISAAGWLGVLAAGLVLAVRRMRRVWHHSREDTRSMPEEARSDRLAA